MKSLPKPAQWLKHILKHVPDKGWTDAALLAAAKDMGVDATLVPLVFPNSVQDAVALYHTDLDERMETAIAKRRDFSVMKVRQKIAYAVKARLQLLAGQEDIVRRLHGWAAHPKHAPKALKMLWQSCDKIWWLAGDTATDYNHYTKRLLLAQLYERTLVFWLDDNSRDKAETWDYLEDRIESVMQMGRKISQLKDFAGMAGGFLSKWRAA